MLVAFERTPQSHQGLWGVFVHEQLDTFPEPNHGAIYFALGYLRYESEAHEGPQVLNVDDVLI